MAETTPQQALIYLMVVVSAADRDMMDVELSRIGEIVRGWPIFVDFSEENLPVVARQCQELLQSEGGLEQVLGAATDTLPPILHDTAYAAAVEIAVADYEIRLEEKRVLQQLRQHLLIDADVAKAIELAAKARHRSAS
jgi:tellurite resistance protein